MSKKLIIPTSLKQIEHLTNEVDGFLIPLKDYSVNFSSTFTLEELDEIIKHQKEVFILMNKNFYHTELEPLKETLQKLNTKKIDGIFFYDLAIMNVKEKIQFPLIWAEEHLTTSYHSIHYWEGKGIYGTLLSSEITKDEIIEIKEKTNSKLFVITLGYIPIFTSKRHLVKNYLKTFNLSEAKNYTIEKENKKYPIIDNSDGTFVYTSHILDIREDVKDLNLDYEIYNANEIDEQTFEDLIKNRKMENTNKGFLYTETIYKVKK